MFLSVNGKTGQTTELAVCSMLTIYASLKGLYWLQAGSKITLRHQSHDRTNKLSLGWHIVHFVCL